MKKILVIIISFFCFCNTVFAIECDTLKVTEAYGCADVGKSGISNSSCLIDSNSPPGSSKENVPYQEITQETSVIKHTIPGNKYVFMFLIDDSGSMKDDDGKRIKIVRNNIKSFIKKMKKKYGASMIYFYYLSKNEPIYSHSITGMKSVNKIIEKKDFVVGTPTYYVTGLKTITRDVKKLGDGLVPFVAFFTDGYPTAEHKNYDLGALSSARYFYNASKKMKELGDAVHKHNGGKIITLGVDLSAEDTMAKYLLNPNDNTKKSLASDGNNEAQRYYSMITKGSVKFAELVGGSGGIADRGIIGYSSYNSKKIVFSNHKALDNNLGSIWIGPIKGGSNYKLCAKYDYQTTETVKVKYKEKKCKKWNKKKTKCKKWETVTKSRKEKQVVTKTDSKCVDSNGTYKHNSNSGYKFIKFNANKKKFKDNSDVLGSRWTFESKTSFSYDTYSANKRIDLNGVVDKYYNKVTTIENLAALAPGYWEETIKKDVCKTINNFVPKKVDNNYCKDSLITVSNSKGNFDVLYTMTEVVTFDGGSLKNKQIVSAGQGFHFKDIWLKKHYSIGFRHYSNHGGGSKEPVAILKKGPKRFRVKFSKAGLDVNSVKNEIWKRFSDNVNVQATFKTIDSNNAKDKNKDIKDNVDEKITSHGYDITGSYNVKKGSYNYKTKKFEYGACDGDACLPGLNYYIPYDYVKEKENDEIKVNVSFPSSLTSANLSTVCKVDVSLGGDDITGGESKKILNYRSIDLNNPFPRANNLKEQLPKNWQDFYCSNVSCPNNINKLRLVNSYNYTPQYVANLTSDTLLDNVLSGSYTSFSDINNDGTSKFVNNNLKVITNKDKHFCKLGYISDKFGEGCDQYR